MKTKLFILFVGLFYCVAAFATDPHHDPEVITIHETTVIEQTVEQTVVNNKIVKGNDEGIALGIAAAQHHFDISTYSWQGSIAVGRYEDNQAFSFAAAKRVYSDKLLVNGSVGVENGKKAFGAGLNWRFK